MPLLAGEMSGQLRSRWNSIQTGFVDEPRSAVEQADSLVAEAMQHITETFASERTKMQNQWNNGGNASTEDLRLALQQYRSLFNRLTSI